MCFEMVLEIMRVSGVAIIADRKTVNRIIQRCVIESWVICDIANAAPVLDF